MADGEHWSARLEDAAVAAGVPGAVLGVWSGGETTVVPYGVLSTRTGVSTTADSLFQIGSITKTWTATIVAQLVARVGSTTTRPWPTCYQASASVGRTRPPR